MLTQKMNFTIFYHFLYIFVQKVVPLLWMRFMKMLKKTVFFLKMSFTSRNQDVSWWNIPIYFIFKKKLHLSADISENRSLWKNKKNDHFLSCATQIVVLRFYSLCVKSFQDCPDVAYIDYERSLYMILARKLVYKNGHFSKKKIIFYLIGLQ